jgi:hypothetical protein
MYVTGNGIAPGATISAVAGATIGSVVTLSLNNTGTVGGLVVFATPPAPSSQTGPWIVYDRIGDRDIITQSMIAQLYLQPVNVPAVIRGKFSEVSGRYKFLPYVAQGDLINMYYYKAWELLFAPLDDEIISTTGTVTVVSGTGPYIVDVTDLQTVNTVNVGDILVAMPDTGELGIGTVTQITSSNSVRVEVASGVDLPVPVDGTVINVAITGRTVQTNPVLETWGEGYVYGTLREYYIKRHNTEDATVYAQKFDNAWNTVEDQNNLGKWSGGHTRLTSVWQPRQYRQYNIK